MDDCNPAAGHDRGQHPGRMLMDAPLDPGFSLTGVILWGLALVLVFSDIASFYPAWKASRLTVNEVLAYE